MSSRKFDVDEVCVGAGGAGVWLANFLEVSFKFFW